MRSADTLVSMVAIDEDLQKALKEDPVSALKKISSQAKADTPSAIYQRDKWVYRTVVVALGLVLLTAAGGAIALALAGKTMPEGLVAFGSAAVGALAGLFAPSPIQQGGQGSGDEGK
jgi:hypothetical protein